MSDEDYDDTGNPTPMSHDTFGNRLAVFNRDCIVCGETFKAKSKRHKKCDRCKHITIREAEEIQQVKYQQGKFGIAELDDLGEDVFDEDDFEADTGYTHDEIYDMFSEQDEDDYLEDEEEWG